MPDPRATTPVRLVATDLDGTLLSPAGTVTRRTADAVAAVRAAGIHVVPVTGRPAKSVWDLAAVAGLGPYGICSNGAALVDLDRPAVLDHDRLDNEVARDWLAAVRAAVPGVRAAVDTGDAFVHEPSFFETVVDWDETITEVADVAVAFDGTVSQLIVRRPGLPALELIDHLRPVLADTANLTTSGLDWVEVAPTWVSKAGRLAELCDRLGIGPEEVVAVGDHVNDLSMLAWAGTSLAVANAVEPVLAVVDRVLPANADHGVAVLLEELVEHGADLLGPPGPGPGGRR